MTRDVVDMVFLLNFSSVSCIDERRHPCMHAEGQELESETEVNVFKLGPRQLACMYRPGKPIL